MAIWCQRVFMSACRAARRFYISELQLNAVPIWWSTGVYDPLFPPSLLKSYTEIFSAVRSPENSMLIQNLVELAGKKGSAAVQCHCRVCTSAVELQLLRRINSFPLAYQQQAYLALSLGARLSRSYLLTIPCAARRSTHHGRTSP